MPNGYLSSTATSTSDCCACACTTQISGSRLRLAPTSRFAPPLRCKHELNCDFLTSEFETYGPAPSKILVSDPPSLTLPSQHHASLTLPGRRVEPRSTGGAPPDARHLAVPKPGPIFKMGWVEGRVLAAGARGPNAQMRACRFVLLFFFCVTFCCSKPSIQGKWQQQPVVSAGGTARAVYAATKSTRPLFFERYAPPARVRSPLPLSSSLPVFRRLYLPSFAN